MESLLANGAPIPVENVWWRQRGPATAWLGEARTALHALFPANHPLCRQWDAIFERAKTYKIDGWGGPLPEPFADVHFEQALGVLQAALTVVKAGRMRTLLDGVRAETVSEVLDLADVLLGGKHVIAAAVLAGGALETHLRHLCMRSGLTWAGDGSIAKYDQAIAQARNAGTVTAYPATDSKLIGGWGGLRNEAAHDPTHFTRTVDEVRLMNEGIRQFIARVP
jgi:hypothetical protein